MAENTGAPAPTKIHFDQHDVDENKVLAALSYIWILFLVPLLAKKDSKFCKEHAKQGLIMFIVWIVASFVIWIPLIGWLLGLALLIVDIVAFVKALQGEFWEIPVIGPLRNKFNL
ncbi:MAG: DUF4870 domain-containing protein [Patescibacteria group bacterium]|nr:DUF4870 domain-containing protein [Patescibacteria group bacterium]